MKYSDNITIQKFIEKLVDSLKYENTYRELRELKGKKFDIPFLISALWQDLTSNYEHYDEFCSDLRNYDNYNIVIEDDNYCTCKACVDFFNEIMEALDFGYEIVFDYDERNWRYCECNPSDLDYREDKHCCGHGCDWNAPSIEVRKSFIVSNHSWDGDEHDYWDFEDKFYESDNEENERKMKEEREYKIKSLKETIENAQRELKELENL